MKAAHRRICIKTADLDIFDMPHQNLGHLHIVLDGNNLLLCDHNIQFHFVFSTSV